MLMLLRLEVEAKLNSLCLINYKFTIQGFVYGYDQLVNSNSF